MASGSKADYLKRYLSKDDLPKDEKKKKRKKIKPARDSKLKIIDDDVDLDHLSAQRGGGLDDLDDGPVVAEYIDERPKHVQVLEQFRKTDKWKVLGEEDDGIQIESKMHTRDSSLKAFADISKKRHDSDSGDSPPRKNNSRHDSDSDESLPRKNNARHDSDTSPKRKSSLRNDSNSNRLHPRKNTVRHDSDSDESPLRKNTKRACSDSDRSPPRRNTARHDSDQSPPRRNTARHDSDQSPPRRNTARHDSDQSLPRRNTARHDSDQSPPRRNTARHDSDQSPPRRNTARHDSDQSPPRRSTVRHDSDQSPPRNHSIRHDSDSDQSPPRKNSTRPDLDVKLYRKGKTRQDSWSPPVKRKHSSDSDLSPSRKRNSKFDPSPPRIKLEQDSARNNIRASETRHKSGKTLSGAKAGLSSAQEMHEEAKKLREKEERAFKKIDDKLLGRNAATVVRDKETGRRKNTEEENAKNMEEEKRKEELKKKYEVWGKGIKQQQSRSSVLEDQIHEASKPLARYKDDEDLDKMYREEERDEDPMLAYIRSKRKKEEEKSGKTKKKEFPRYKGPAPQPNRFNIMPGYRWDGVDRSNGFEKKIFAHAANKKATEEIAYKWSTEDM